MKLERNVNTKTSNIPAFITSFIERENQVQRIRIEKSCFRIKTR